VSNRLGRTWRACDALYVARALGLTGGLKLALDAGAAASYGGSGQSWLDLSGNGTDFFLGADGSATATDPTFSGSSGRVSGGEYWSFDGGDYFTYDSANETWMEAIHKDGARFTFLMWVYKAATGVNQGLIGTSRNNVADTGFVLSVITNERLQFIAEGNAGAAVLSIDSGSGLTVPAGQWALVGISLDEATGANGAAFFVNGATSTWSSTYTSPSSGAATNTLKIAARGNAGFPLSNTSRLAAVWAWEGRALSEGEMRAVFDATRGRFAV
jgi:hypothetical protein